MTPMSAGQGWPIPPPKPVMPWASIIPSAGTRASKDHPEPLIEKSDSRFQQHQMLEQNPSLCVQVICAKLNSILLDLKKKKKKKQTWRFISGHESFGEK